MKIKQEQQPPTLGLKQNSSPVSTQRPHVPFKRRLARDLMLQRIASYHSLLAPRPQRASASQHFAKTAAENSSGGSTSLSIPKLTNLCAMTHYAAGEGAILQSSVSNTFFDSILVKMTDYIAKHAPELMTRGFVCGRILGDSNLSASKTAATATATATATAAAAAAANGSGGPVDISDYMKMEVCEDNRMKGFLFVTWSFLQNEKGTAAVYAVYLHLLLFGSLSSDLFTEKERARWKYVISALRFQCAMLEANGDVMWSYLTGDGEGGEYRALMHRKVYERGRDVNGHLKQIEPQRKPSVAEYKLWVAAFRRAIFIRCERFGAPMCVKIREK